MDEDDPWDWFDRGYDFHRRGGHPAEAEHAYRRAIAGGVAEAHLNLAILLSAQPNRERDEEAALRAATGCDDLEIAALAALFLGAFLDIEKDDPDAARACYEFAEKYGPVSVAFDATKSLAQLLAYHGDLEGARDRIRSFMVWFGDEHNQDLIGTHGDFAALAVMRVAAGRFTREGFRRFRRTQYRAGRACRAFVGRSERLTSGSQRVAQARSRWSERFWRDDE